MAQDTSIINGVSTESLSPQLEGGLALVTGLVFGFVWCWQMSLVMLACTPILAIGGVLEMEFQKGVQLEENDNIRNANLLCGDAILNYRTVQSFGYEHLVVETYRKLLYPGVRQQTIRQLKSGFAYGLSQITQFIAFALMFYVAGLIIEDNFVPETGVYEVNPEDVFLALFAIMMGAMHSGTAASFGPDMGKALAAATRVFKIMEHPSQIDAVAIDKDPTKKRINPKEVEGKIEFRDVWFRYPTRKEDFVLRGLNITINP